MFFFFPVCNFYPVNMTFSPNVLMAVALRYFTLFHANWSVVVLSHGFYVWCARLRSMGVRVFYFLFFKHQFIY